VTTSVAGRRRSMRFADTLAGLAQPEFVENNSSRQTTSFLNSWKTRREGAIPVLELIESTWEVKRIESLRIDYRAKPRSPCLL